MNQDSLDNKFKDILGSMDEHDTLEAINRKEDVWKKVSSNKKRKNKSYWWLLLLIGGLLLTGAWFFNSYRNTKTKISPSQSFADNAAQVKDYEIQLTQAQLTLASNQRLLDSVSLVNKDLASKISDLKKVRESSKIPSTIIKYDTVYLTEIKTEEKIVEIIVERVIRDTVFVDRIITTELTEPVAELANEKNTKETKTPSESSRRPSSVKFNFSEANRQDN